MAHWAEINEFNKVVRVVATSNDLPDEGYSELVALGGRWIKTSYNANIRGKFAGIGDYYNEAEDKFYCVAEDIVAEQINNELF